MSTQKKAVSQELDSKFVVSDYLSSNPPVPMPLISAIQAMTVPQRFQVEQAMNEIVSKWSEVERKAYTERCTVHNDDEWKIVEFTLRTSERNRSWRVHSIIAPKVLLKWLQQFPFVRIASNDIIFLITRWITFNNIDGPIIVTVDHSSTQATRHFIGDRKLPLTLTPDEVETLSSPKRDTSKLTLNDCLKLIQDKRYIWAPGGYWLSISVELLHSEIK